MFQRRTSSTRPIPKIEAEKEDQVAVVVEEEAQEGIKVPLFVVGGDFDFSALSSIRVPNRYTMPADGNKKMISNDEYKSVEHRVVANLHKEGRVSIAVFFNPGKRGETDLYGPLPELVSPKKPAVYRNFTMSEFLGTFFKKGLGSRCLVEMYEIKDRTICSLAKEILISY